MNENTTPFKKADCYDDVDWRQFAEGDQFTGIVATQIAECVPVIISVEAPYHPDMQLVIKDMIANHGPNFHDLCVDTDEVEDFDFGQVYYCLFELTENGSEEDALTFKVVGCTSMTGTLERTKPTFRPYVKRKTLPSSASSNQDKPEEEASQVTGKISIQW